MTREGDALPVVAVAVTLFLAVAAVAPAAAGDAGPAADRAGPGQNVSCATSTPPNATVDVIAGPPSVADGNWSATEIQAAYRCDARVRETGNVAVGDTLVVRLRAPGLRDAVESQAGENTTDRFRALVASDRANLTAEQTPETTSPMKPPSTLALLNGTRVVHSYEDTYYLVADTGNLQTKVEGDDGIVTEELYGDEAYRIRLEHGGHVENDTVMIQRPKVEFSDRNAEGRVYRDPAPGQTFAGPTTLAAGQNLTLTVSDAWTGETLATGSGETTLNRSDVRRFRATVDLSSVEPTTNLSLSVRSADGRELAADVPLRLAESNATVAVTTANASDEWGYVDATANLSRGGFLVLYAGGPDGTVLDSSDFSAAGSAEARLHFEDVPREHRADGTAELTVVAHRDADGDGRFEAAADPAYDERAAADTTTVRVPADDDAGETTTTTTVADGSTTTDDDTTTAGGDTTSSDAADGTTTDDESAGGGLPGFGMSAALVALVTGLAALARRR